MGHSVWLEALGSGSSRKSSALWCSSVCGVLVRSPPRVSDFKVCQVECQPRVERDVVELRGARAVPLCLGVLMFLFLYTLILIILIN